MALSLTSHMLSCRHSGEEVQLPRLSTAGVNNVWSQKQPSTTEPPLSSKPHRQWWMETNSLSHTLNKFKHAKQLINRICIQMWHLHSNVTNFRLMILFAMPPVSLKLYRSRYFYPKFVLQKRNSRNLYSREFFRQISSLYWHNRTIAAVHFDTMFALCSPLLEDKTLSFSRQYDSQPS